MIRESVPLSQVEGNYLSYHKPALATSDQIALHKLKNKLASV